MESERRKDGQESSTGVKAGGRFAHTERFKSSEKCADHIHDNKPKRFNGNTSIGSRRKMSGSIFVHL